METNMKKCIVGSQGYLLLLYVHMKLTQRCICYVNYSQCLKKNTICTILNCQWCQCSLYWTLCRNLHVIPIPQSVYAHKHTAGVRSRVASPLCVRRGKVKEPPWFLPFLMFSSFSWFFPSFPYFFPFSQNFPSFSWFLANFLPSFPNFWQLFLLSGGGTLPQALPPPPPLATLLSMR